jgi:hypothetical protein
MVAWKRVIGKRFVGTQMCMIRTTSASLTLLLPRLDA